MSVMDSPFRILFEVQEKCRELSQKIDSLLNLLEILEIYMTYNSTLSPNQNPMKGNDAMNPQELQKILASAQKKDRPMSQDEFNAVFETLKQGKSPEEVARMEQMVQMAKSFLK